MRFSCPLEIRFVDVDVLGHVNNANYFTYFEEARIHYLDEVLGKGISYTEMGVILARAEADFLQPVYMRDKLVVKTACTRIGTKSFDLRYEIIKLVSGSEMLMTKGLTTMVCYDYKSNKTVEVPAEWRKKFEEFEGKHL